LLERRARRRHQQRVRRREPGGQVGRRLPGHDADIRARGGLGLDWPVAFRADQQEQDARPQIGERQDLVEALLGIDPPGIGCDRPVLRQAQPASRLRLGGR
jgi:hypothetical protein